MKKLFYLLIACLISSAVFAQESSKKVTLLWDSSYGMSKKDLGKEFTFLNSYFRRYPTTNLQLIVFSNTELLNEKFEIRNGEWTELKNELTNIIYDGAAAFSNLFSESTDEYILVTDGFETIDFLPTSAPKPVNIISSTPTANIAGLRALSVSSGGAFINMAKDSQLVSERTESEVVEITGRVIDTSGPLSGVTITANGRNVQTSTNDSGNYTISVPVGTLLRFNHIGKQTKVERVPSSGRLNVSLLNLKEELEEVLVTVESANLRPEEVVNTGNRGIEKKKLGYGVESITEEDITEQDINLETAIRGQFSNVDLLSDQNINEYLSRGRNMSILLDQTGLIVVDGVPVESNPDALLDQVVTAGAPRVKNILMKNALLDPNNVESITVLKGLAATNKYGTLGRNGVILVTTKSSGFGNNNKKRAPVKLGTTSTYTGDATAKRALPKKSYIKELQKATDINDAYSIYLRQREQHGKSPTFFLDVASYFSDWNNTFLLERILSNLAELPSTNTETLLALAYKYESLNKIEQATKLYERILVQDGTRAQHYRNLALAYQKVGNEQGAMNLYRNIDNNAIEELNGVTGIQNILASEFNNLKAQKEGRMLTSYADPNKGGKDLFDKRIVFEWNAFDAEFDLQIVNPQNRYYTWSHTMEMDGQRMVQEMQEGTGIEEFFMTNEDVGNWLFNITYLGKNQGNNDTPTYLKITTYSNYGKASQTEEVKVVRLDELNKKMSVLSVDI